VYAFFHFLAESRPNLNKTSLVVVDIQKGIVAMGGKLEPYTANQVVANISKLLYPSRVGDREAGERPEQNLEGALLVEEAAQENEGKCENHHRRF